MFCHLSIFTDEQVDSTDDLTAWTETQQDRWDRVSWSSDTYDEDVVRARQSPYPFHDLTSAEVEVEEEVHRPTTARNDQPCCDSALTHVLINRLIAQGEEIRHRTIVIHTEYREQSEVYYTSLCRRIEEGFAAIHERMDAQDIKIRELQTILYERYQRLENSIHRLQAVEDENNERVLFILNDQLRERRLIVNLLGVISSAVRRR